MEKKLRECFEDLETEKKYDGYYYSVGEALIIAIMGCICGLKNLSQIHQWAVSERVRGFLKEKFEIERIPSYFWLISLIKMIKPESLNKCFMSWVNSILPTEHPQTISMDGKTIRSTEKMESYKSSLHIVSAQLAELGITYAQKTVDGKSNEIPAVQELIKELNIKGCIVVADALNCQKETAREIINGEGDYILNAKGNQKNLQKEIEEYVQDDECRKGMDTICKKEKNRGRLETRTAYTTSAIEWMSCRSEWEKMCCIGAIHRESETKSNKTSEWHYYISSKSLTAEELLVHARLEWSVETMHWLLDVHFNEDYCRVEDQSVQQNLNMARKIALNIVKLYKQKTSQKRALSNIMLDCLLSPQTISRVLGV